MENVCGNNESLSTASFNISLKISKAKRPFSIGEDLIDACTEVTGEAQSTEM
jgi:hypothetical protein